MKHVYLGLVVLCLAGFAWAGLRSQALAVGAAPVTISDAGVDASLAQVSPPHIPFASSGPPIPGPVDGGGYLYGPGPGQPLNWQNPGFALPDGGAGAIWYQNDAGLVAALPACSAGQSVEWVNGFPTCYVPTLLPDAGAGGLWYQGDAGQASPLAECGNGYVLGWSASANVPTCIAYDGGTAGITWANDLDGSSNTHQYVVNISGGSSPTTVTATTPTLDFSQASTIQTTTGALSVDSKTALDIGPTVATSIVVGNSSTVTALSNTVKSGDPFTVVNGSSTVLDLSASTANDQVSFSAAPGTTGYIRLPWSAGTETYASVATQGGILGTDSSGNLIMGYPTANATTTGLSVAVLGQTAGGSSTVNGGGVVLVGGVPAGSVTPGNYGGIIFGWGPSATSLSENVQFATGAGLGVLLWSNGANVTVKPTLLQSALSSTSSGNGAAGEPFEIFAQNGQATSHSGSTGGTGGNLIIGPGGGGTGATGGPTGYFGVAMSGNVSDLSMQLGASTSDFIAFDYGNTASAGYLRFPTGTQTLMQAGTQALLTTDSSNTVIFDSSAHLSIGGNDATLVSVGNSGSTAESRQTIETGHTGITGYVGSTEEYLINASASDFLALGGAGATAGFLRFPSGAQNFIEASSSYYPLFFADSSQSTWVNAPTGDKVILGINSAGILTGTSTTLTVAPGVALNTPTTSVAATGQSVTSSTALVNVTNMSAITMGASDTWTVTYELWITFASTEGIQLAVTTPTGATLSFFGCLLPVGAGSGVDCHQGSTSGTGVNFSDGAGTAALVHIVATVVGGGTHAGSITLQFAQNSSSSTATVITAGSATEAVRQ